MGILGACSSTTYQRPAVHRAGPGMSGYYGTRTPGDLAYGGPTGLQSTEPKGAFDLDQYLKAQAREPIAKAQPTRARTHARAQAPQPALMPEIAMPMVEVPAATAPAPAPTVVADATPPTPHATTPSSDAERYGAREAQSSQQQRYRGGDVVVISVSTLLIVLLIVLIVLLLT